jgi:hypothetical protein
MVSPSSASLAKTEDDVPDTFFHRCAIQFRSAISINKALSRLVDC